MRKLLLITAAAIMLAGPALAETKSITVNLSGVAKTRPPQSTIVNMGMVVLIAFGNRVDVYDPTTHTITTALTVTVPLATIKDMVFTAPSFLTVQGGGAFAVTIDYSTVPPTIFPPVSL
jgi:hypothetical protein